MVNLFNMVNDQLTRYGQWSTYSKWSCDGQKIFFWQKPFTIRVLMSYALHIHEYNLFNVHAMHHAYLDLAFSSNYTGGKFLKVAHKSANDQLRGTHLTIITRVL